jgi:hypothetical protein
MGVTNLDALTLGGELVVVDAVDVEGLATAENVLSVPDVASGGVLAVHTTQTITHSLRIQSADGTNYYIMLTDTVTNRTGGA